MQINDMNRQRCEMVKPELNNRIETHKILKQLLELNEKMLPE